MKTLLLPFLSGVAALAAEPLAAQQRPVPISRVQYDLTFDSARAQSRSIGVSMSFSAGGPGEVLLSLPAWTPGSYELGNYARFVSSFRASSGTDSLDWDKADPDTWRVTVARQGEVKVAFDYTADSLDNAMSWSKPDFGFFNGTNLFLYPEGLDAQFTATVTVHTQPGWRVATGMTSGGGVNSFTASSYHDLVDFPFFVGRFESDSTIVAGKPFRFVSYPAGSVSAATRAAVFQQMAKIIPAQAMIFGEVPWNSYTLLQVADSTFSLGAAAGLEHQNSHLDIVSSVVLGNPFLISLYSHEVFHAWNVKRLRPAEMFPYAYNREQPTPLLWISEGVTDYYADITQVRAKVLAPRAFYVVTKGKIDTVEESAPTALEDASVSAWVKPVNGTEDLYYDKGSVAAFLLDIMIRDASDNRRSLDTVMRELYESTYKRGRGFSNADWWSAVSRAASGKSFAEFERRYVDGREQFPYDSVFPLAGLKLLVERSVLPSLGLATSADDEGLRVMQIVVGGAGSAAGVKLGDYLVRIGGLDVSDTAFQEKFNAKFGAAPPGGTIAVEVKRGTQRLTLNAPAKFNTIEGRRLIEMTNATPKAIRVRDGLLNGTLQP
ncbi:MAG TPA: PDZ domain-containing protein [Gemmatimonadaceae bacterium]|nr:PDZ domain-containing protein [Gemmatimonadaceae bacterium]